MYRKIQTSFWEDGKIVDNFTPDDKYFYLYLMTNPHTNLCGCYEISRRQMENETGYTPERVEKELQRICELHKIAAYSDNTKELLLYNWHKYNWKGSDTLKKGIISEIDEIKNAEFAEFLLDVFNGNNDRQTPTGDMIEAEKPAKSEKKRQYGEYKKVLLTDNEYNRLIQDFGDEKTQKAIVFFDAYIKEKGYKTKSHYLAMRRWVFRAIEEQDAGRNKWKSGGYGGRQSDEEFNEILNNG